MVQGIKDIEDYTHNGNFGWKEAAENGKAQGIMAVIPHEDMLDPQGYDKDITNKGTKSYITVHFDKDYVHEFIHRKILLGCGFMRGTTLNEEGLRKFIDQQIEYSLTENTRIAESNLIKDAQDMSERYGQSVEYWTETLRNAAQVAKEKTTASNGKTREKVAA